jgi:colanic acid biosynthesis protein WcaH
MKLTDQEFIDVVRVTPLVAIDLIVRNEAGEILLGKRRNRPAQHWWFVPGGRIQKNERLQDAYRRIGKAELGITMPNAKLHGIFNHLYDDNYFGVPDIGTHYVTLAYRCELGKGITPVHDDQHAEMKWWAIDALMQSDSVHANTKAYFLSAAEDGMQLVGA